MNFSCPACQAKYFVKDEDVLGRTLKLACRSCSADIPIQGRRSRQATSHGPPRSISSDRLVLSLEHARAPSGAVLGDRARTAAVRPSMPPPLPADLSQSEFYVAVRGEPVGPLAADEVAARVRGGEVSARTYVWRPGEQSWQRLGEVAEFAYLLARASVPPSLAWPISEAPQQTLEERLGFGYLGGEPASSRPAASPSEKRVRLALDRRPTQAKRPWTPLFVGLVISLAVGMALGSML